MNSILIVEDNEMNRDMLSRRLKRRGFDLLIAEDGARGMAVARESKPDLILMDMSLPEVDGWEASRQLKADPDTAGIPIIALTAHAMAGDREKALGAGCDEYETKPVELPRLLEKIDRLLAAPATSSASADTPPAPANPAPEGLVELDRMRQVAEECGWSLRELADMYLDQTGDQLNQLATAIESGAAAEVARLAHGCAGASGTSGVSSMVSLFRELEAAGENERMGDTGDLLKKAQDQFEKIRELLKSAPSD